jgi:AcrR family transcriptional regulator
MSIAERKNAEETRACILNIAWDLFRQLGTRTTIAEVAEKLGMSSANIYRFFPSKQALSEAVCENVLRGLLTSLAGIAERSGSAADRIRDILMTMHRTMRDQMVSASRVHEIVDIAIQERWTPIEAFERKVVGLLGELIAEGQSNGEFGAGDPLRLGKLTLCACSGTHHPVLIALYDTPDADPKPDEVVGFALRALAHREPGNGG